MPRANSHVAWWTLLALLPVTYIAIKVVFGSRNIVFWDEFDTVLQFLLRIDASQSWSDSLAQIFAVENEHRTVTSRLLFLGSYWLTSAVNFHVLGTIGNLFMLTTCIVLVGTAGSVERRVRLGVLLAFVMFTLHHLENFFWSGASIDHFQVVLLAVGALIALSRGTRPAWLGAGLLALLATFTLAQGCAVWPVGAVMLARDRRWRHLAGWCGLGALALAGFLRGFEFNPGHQVAGFSVAGLVQVTHYWLALLGGPLTFGDRGTAPVLGVILLAGLGWFAARGACDRERIAFSVALFAIGALALIAVGRVLVSDGQLSSRYMVLGALAWAMLGFLALEKWTTPTRPFRVLAWCLPALITFNVSANVRFVREAHVFVEARDRAATRFIQHGADGHGEFKLHPQSDRVHRLLAEAAARGIYTLPQFCLLQKFSGYEPTDTMMASIDEMTVNGHAVFVRGWALVPGYIPKPGQVYLALRSEKSFLVYSTVPIVRPDVAAALHDPRAGQTGFRFVAARARLPAEKFQVGFLFAANDRTICQLTDRWIDLTDRAQ